MCVSRSTVKALLPLWIYLSFILFVNDVVLVHRSGILASAPGLLALAILLILILVLVYQNPSDICSQLEGELYSGHCEQCKRILLESPLVRGLSHDIEEAYPFDNRSSDCQLCRFLFDSVPAAGSNLNLNDISSRSETRSYGTMDHGSSVAEMGLSTSVLRIFRNKHHGFNAAIQLRTPGGLSPGFTLYSAKGERGFHAAAYKDSLAGTTGSDEIVNSVAQWITSCMQSHPECRPIQFCPKRLLRILSIDKAVLIEPVLAEWPNHKYAALSHCWGPKGVLMRLTSHTKPFLGSPFRISELPPNFRDAAQFAFKLGIRYLWIDSLCIMQDSNGDWEEQSAAMSDIYAGAVCTIAATASSDSQGGCFRMRLGQCVLLGSQKAYKYLMPDNPMRRVGIQKVFEQEVESSPWNKRAWTYQERLLSCRIVHFTENLVLFECNCMRASEWSPLGERYERNEYIRRDGRLYRGEALAIISKKHPELISWPYKRKPRIFRSGRREGVAGTGLVRNPLWLQTHHLQERFISQSAKAGIRGALEMLQSLHDDQSIQEKIESHSRWYEIVWRYTQRDLTYKSDRLVALAGLTNLVAAKSGRRNVAGLWESTLALDLLWVPLSPQVSEADVSIAPTWSWASVNGPVRSLIHAWPGISYYKLHHLQENDGRNIIAEATVEPPDRVDNHSLVYSQKASPKDYGAIQDC